jgi:tetratricopeptide (TPR) repeat protein
MNAVTFFGEALIIAKMMGNRQAESNIYSHLGVAYGIMKSYPLAIDYHVKALKYNKEISDRSSVSKTLTHLGKIYFDLHDFVASKKSYLEALDTALEASDSINEVRVYLGLAQLYHKFTDYQSTENYLNKAMTLATKRNAYKELIRIHDMLSECNKSKGMYDIALNNLEMSKMYEKKILEMEEEHKIRNILLHKSFQTEMYLTNGNGSHLSKLKTVLSGEHSITGLRKQL